MFLRYFSFWVSLLKVFWVSYIVFLDLGIYLVYCECYLIGLYFFRLVVIVCEKVLMLVWIVLFCDEFVGNVIVVFLMCIWLVLVVINV